MTKRAGDDLQRPAKKRAPLPPQDAHFSKNSNNHHHKSHSRGPPPRQMHSNPTTSPTLPSPLPPLPPLSAALANAPFLHKSAVQHSRTTAHQDMSYERLEFLGDAYIELWATKIIFPRFHYLPAGRMSQVREMLVKNETLAEYSRAYRFDKNIAVDSLRHMETAAAAPGKGNKGLTKIYGDVFEAYVAAVVLSDETEGEKVAENWTKALWEPRLAAYERDNPAPVVGTYIPNVGEEVDPRKRFDPNAKQTLTTRLVFGKEVRLEYQPYKPMLELKGDQLGQNRHYIGVYLTGYGYEKKLLGKAEGKNKHEAGQWAAIEAMYGESKKLVADLEKQCEEAKQRKWKLYEEAASTAV